MIEAHQLTKRYGEKTAVDRLDFVVRPGTVTGFLGPNGAGKSTTMRMIVGLDAPSGGSVTVNGKHYAEHTAPLQEVGALLEAKSIHPGRSAFDHLMAQAYTHGIPRRRVEEVIELTGLQSVAKKRAGAFSLGMGQRLGLAAALLGDPPVLVLDEPVNGLDTEGIRWLRELLRSMAAEGRTVLISSHLMTEMALVADHLVVISRGRLLADTGMSDFIERHGRSYVRVRTPEPDRLGRELEGRGATVTRVPGGGLDVVGMAAADVSRIAAAGGFPLDELGTHAGSLEETFLDVIGEGQPVLGQEGRNTRV